MHKKTSHSIGIDVSDTEAAPVKPAAKVGNDSTYFVSRLSGIALCLKQRHKLVNVNTQRTLVQTKCLGKFGNGCHAHVSSCSHAYGEKTENYAERWRCKLWPGKPQRALLGIVSGSA